MLTLAQPLALALLPLPLFVYRWGAPYRRTRAAVRVPFFDRLLRASGNETASSPPDGARSGPRWAVLLLAWLGLVAALARPTWLEEPVVRELPMRDLLVALDLSGSMDTEDFADESGAVLDRLSAARRVLDAFIARREGDRVGLILFGTAAFVQAPLTEDLAVVRQLLDEATVRMLGPRTAIGDAMGLAMHLFERSAVEDRVLVLLTDGNDTGSLVPPARAAEIARDQGVVVHAIAMGDPAAAGEAALDEQTLETVASITRGGYFRAMDREDLDAVYARIDELTPRQVETLSHRPRRELYAWPLGAALLLTLGWSGAGQGRRALRSLQGRGADPAAVTRGGEPVDG
jgi:Ca-activated chloride channel family protein